MKQRGKKEIQKMMTNTEPSETMLNAAAFEPQVSQKNKTKRKGMKKYLKKVPKMGEEIATQLQETQRVPNRINPRRNTPRHILIKLMKIKHKEQILKAAREKQQITHKGILIKGTKLIFQ